MKILVRKHSEITLPRDLLHRFANKLKLEF